MFAFPGSIDYRKSELVMILNGPWGSLFRGEHVRSKIGVYVPPQAGGMDLRIGPISILPIKA